MFCGAIPPIAVHGDLPACAPKTNTLLIAISFQPFETTQLGWQPIALAGVLPTQVSGSATFFPYFFFEIGR
jgi:hypothetical protein